MWNKIFIYLFLFTLLFVIFQYMNEKSIYEAQENKIARLESEVNERNDSIKQLRTKIHDLDYFTLLGNENAMTYLEQRGLEADAVKEAVSNKIYDANLVKGNNPLVPYEGMEGPMKINKLKFLNHKWILADFTDGKFWGEMILEYDFNNEGQLELKSIASLLYPN